MVTLVSELAFVRVFGNWSCYERYWFLWTWSILARASLLLILWGSWEDTWYHHARKLWLLSKVFPSGMVPGLLIWMFNGTQEDPLVVATMNIQVNMNLCFDSSSGVPAFPQPCSCLPPPLFFVSLSAHSLPLFFWSHFTWSLEASGESHTLLLTLSWDRIRVIYLLFYSTKLKNSCCQGNVHPFYSCVSST